MGGWREREEGREGGRDRGLEGGRQDGARTRSQYDAGLLLACSSSAASDERGRYNLDSSQDFPPKSMDTVFP